LGISNDTAIVCAMTRTSKGAIAALALCSGLGLSACGGSTASGNANTVPATPDLTVVAKDIAFDQASYTVAKAGTVSIAYKNTGNLTHTLVFKTLDGTKVGNRLLVSPGKTVGESIKLDAGSYQVLCDVPGHAAMKAILKVG